MASTEYNNRLAHETSPYLLQHAHQPVDWYPWGPEALDKARLEDKPIFLSIGYSACHWCHVMSRECFDNEELARQMNERFINIKVDREERPEIDAIYMNALIAMNGQGGWPLNLFLTPEQEPYLGGTYFPPVPGNHQPSFGEVLRQAQDQYRNQKEQVQSRSGDILRKINATQVPVAAQENSAQTLITAAVQLLTEKFDESYGGFGAGMKFPEPMLYSLLLRHWVHSESNDVLMMVDKSLTHMAEGGMYDQLGGGFHRYSTDREWRVPHFEKMLCDNALMARLYLDAFQATQQEIYQVVAEDIFAYVDREMISSEGAFFTSQDADTEGREGVYFTWELKEVLDLLGPRHAQVFAKMYGITPAGQFERRNVLRVMLDMEKTAEEEGVPIFEVGHIIKNGRKALLDARGKRPQPHRDEKILAGWNGLMISALAKGFIVFRKESYLQRATTCADFIWSTLWKDGSLLRVYKDGQARFNGCLEDYAYLLEGLVTLYEASLESRWLEKAQALAEAMIEKFWDKADGGFFMTASDHEPLVARLKTPMDDAMPSANAIAALALLRLGRLTGNKLFEEKGRQTVQAFRGEMEQRPAAFTALLSAMDYMETSPVEIVLSGPKDDKEYQSMLETLYRDYRPNQTVVVFQGEETVEWIPWAEGRGPVSNQPTAYVCKEGTCHPPVHTTHALYNLLGRPPEIRLNIFDEDKKIKDMQSQEQDNFLNAMSGMFKFSGLGKK
jgi:uncharacterized protein YyaL (SSP411 family)